MEVCPQCCNPIVSASCRLVHDTCGHRKCRICLLQEEHGCVTCAVTAETEETVNRSRVSICEYDEDTVYEKSIEIPPGSSSLCKKSENLGYVKSTQSEPLLETKGINNVLRKNASLENETNTRKKDGGEETEAKPRKRKPIVIESHIVILPGNPTQYQCTICNKFFGARYNLRYHNFCATENKPFNCDVCKKGFVTRSHYECHLRIHSGDEPFVCASCGKGFKQKGKLTRHMKCHTGDRSFICQACGKGFLNADGLRSHQRTHTGEKPYVCKNCTKAFSECSNYKKHLLTHTGEKLFMCEECGRSFALKRSLEVHLYIHSRERNHVCGHCKRGFAMKKDLMRHQIVHSTARPHSCSVCGTGFRRKDNLERHMKNTHPETRIVAGSSQLQQPPPQPPASDVLQNDTDNTEVATENTGVDPKDHLGQSKVPVFRPIIQIGNQGPPVRKLLQAAPQQTSCAKTPPSAPPDPQCVQVSGGILTNEPESVGNLENLTHTHPQANTHENVANDTGNTLQSELKQTSDTQPKEYYRAVPVINRSTNTATDFSKTRQSENHEAAKKNMEMFEGKNCVRTITRASDILNATVIGRASQQNVQTIIKPKPKLECFRKLERPASMVTEFQKTSQPILRMLLNDVECSDKNDMILNLAQDVHSDKPDSLFQYNLRMLENSKFDKIPTKVINDPTLPDAYQSDFLINNCEMSKVTTPNQCVTSDYSRKLTDDFSVDSQFKPGYCQSLSYDDFMVPPYLVDDVGSDRVPLRTDSLLTVDSLANGLKAHCRYVNYAPYLRNEDDSGRLKLLADVAEAKDPSMHASQVIVGTRKLTNNVICSNLNF